MKKILPFLFILSSCATRFNIAEKDFYSKLQILYKNYADFKYDNNDYILGKVFEGKANTIKDGKKIEPEIINFKSKIPYRTFLVEEIQYYRSKMMFLLQNKTTKTEKPDDASKMQFYYDCWVNEETYYTKFGLITNCRKNFLTILQTLEFQLSISNTEVVKKINEKPERELLKPPKKDKKIVIYFDFDSAAINEKANRKIWEVINYVNNLNNYKLKISAHTDREGNIKYNEKLAKERLKTIIHYLIKNKIPAEKIIEEKSEDERNPAVLTKDRTKEYLNRRVDIIIED